MLSIAVPVLVLSFLAGSALAAYGWFGPPVDDHPLCRRCGFDLTGRPTPTARCGECGVDLSERRAIRVGHRRRGRVLLASGTCLLVVAAAGGASLGLAAARHVDWIVHEPTGWLLRTARAHAGTASPELSELLARLSDGRLASADVARVTDAALDVQADASIAWQPARGNLVERAHDRSRLPLDRWLRYARQAMASETIRLTVRPRVRRGSPLPFRITLDPGRIGEPGAADDLNVHVRRAGPADLPPGARTTFDPYDGRTSLGSSTWVQGQLPPLEATGGATPVRLVVDFDLVSDRDGLRAAAAVPLTTSTTVVPASTSTVIVVHDPRLRSVVEQGLSLGLHVQAYADFGRKPFVNVVSYFDGDNPVGLSYRVALCGPKGRVDLGGMAVPAKADIKWRTSGHMPWDADKVDVTFTPDPSAAEATVDALTVWDEPVSLHDVPVLWKR